MAELEIAWGIALFSTMLFFMSQYDKKQLKEKVKELEHYKEYAPRINSIDREETLLKKKQEEFQSLVEEKTRGFPWLAEAYADYKKLLDLRSADYLQNKKHPAEKAADQVRKIAFEKKELEKLYRVYKYKIDYYESLFPWLADFSSDDVDDLIIPTNESVESGQPDTNLDPARQWLTETEYMKLPSVEKYQLALDRYWHKKKSKWEIGRDYERYVGYLYETDGWKVHYQGIVAGFSDLGRDLIATKGEHAEIIQCKYWSKDRQIHEKHIFQLYGTYIAYKIDNPRQECYPVFITSTKLSDIAKKFSDVLQIRYKENYPLEKYPCIKCNISTKDDQKIYHLPFDQQYDSTTIDESRGERFVSTVLEAENLGFRRAFRWHGNNTNSG